MGSKQETFNEFLALIENNYNISILDEDKEKIMHLLNKMHGQSYNSGMQEGIKVTKQFQKLQSKGK